MSTPWWLVRLALIGFSLTGPWSALGYKRNYDAKQISANIPQWKQRACEKSQKLRANSHYVCDDKGDVKCMPGWQGDLCQVPMCRKMCDPMNGYCQRPNECRCRIGYTGENCDKCITLPGCQHGYCNKPFECLCKPGWDGLFCTEPTCRSGCHNTRGYCEAPGECRCRLGWGGRNCSDCAVLPGCQHGTCNKPLDCVCEKGYTGLLCQTPLCSSECNKQHGYCRKPGECRCKVGWTGTSCDKCFPYPGCVNGDCEKPWECNCKPGWGGMLCDEKLTFCEEHPNTCENGARCISLTKEDGGFHCQCGQGYFGKNCEVVDEFMVTSTTAPRITPPPPPREDEDEEMLFSNSTTTLKENKTHLLLPTYGPETKTASKPLTLSKLHSIKANEADIGARNEINRTTTEGTTSAWKWPEGAPPLAPLVDKDSSTAPTPTTSSVNLFNTTGQSDDSTLKEHPTGVDITGTATTKSAESTTVQPPTTTQSIGPINRVTSNGTQVPANNTVGVGGDDAEEDGDEDDDDDDDDDEDDEEGEDEYEDDEEDEDDQ